MEHQKSGNSLWPGPEVVDKKNRQKARQSRLCQKEKSHLSRSPDREVGQSQEHGEKRVDSAVKEGRL